MPLAVTVNKKKYSGKWLEVMMTIVPSGTYPTGGDTLNLSALGIQSSLVPYFVVIYGIAGFLYSWVPGTTQANGKMKVLVATTGGANIPLAEHTNVTYVAGVSGDTITMKAQFELR